MIINSEDIKLNSEVEFKPLINCMLSAHLKTPFMIGRAFDLSSSGLRAGDALFTKLLTTIPGVKPITGKPSWSENELIYGAEIIGESSIQRYLQFGGKIHELKKAEVITKENTAFEVTKEGVVLDIATTSQRQFDEIEAILKSLGVPFKSADSKIRVTDCVGVDALILSGAQFEGAAQFRHLLNYIGREFWVQSGVPEGAFVTSVINVPAFDDGRGRIGNEGENAMLENGLTTHHRLRASERGQTGIRELS